MNTGLSRLSLLRCINTAKRMKRLYRDVSHSLKARISLIKLILEDFWKLNIEHESVELSSHFFLFIKIKDGKAT